MAVALARSRPHRERHKPERTERPPCDRDRHDKQREVMRPDDRRKKEGCGESEDERVPVGVRVFFPEASDRYDAEEHDHAGCDGQSTRLSRREAQRQAD